MSVYTSVDRSRSFNPLEVVYNHPRATIFLLAALIVASYGASLGMESDHLSIPVNENEAGLDTNLEY